MYRPLVARVLIVIVAALVTLTGAGHQAAAQDAAAEPIVGAWLVTVGVEGNPETFMVLQTYEPGGTVTSENVPITETDPTAPIDTLHVSTGVGAWERGADGSYTATIAIMYGDGSGRVLAVETVTWTVTVDASGERFRGEASFIATDPAGTELYIGTSGLVGTRISVLSPGVPVTLPGQSSATPAA